MNIIKFKNIEIVDSPELSTVDFGTLNKDENIAEVFNTYFRGKYAYWISCIYAVPIDELSADEVMFLEQDPDALGDKDVHYIDIAGTELDDNELFASWVIDLDIVDMAGTERANNVEGYVRYNKYVPVAEIDEENLKNFRGWFAGELLEKKDWNDNIRHILEYYRDGMSDDTVKWLSYFGGQTYSIQTVVSKNCGCAGGSTNLASLYNETLSGCDPLTIYKNNIRQGMIALFSDIDTWMEDDETDLMKDFLGDVILYLKQIIADDLPLVTSDSVSDAFSCKCLSDGGYAQRQAQGLLEDLIKAFELIKDSKVSGQKNTIVNTLSSWASSLYENMSWN